MFLRYRIMRCFKWNKSEIPMDELHHSLWLVSAKRFGIALSSLITDGFLKMNPDGIVSPHSMSSFRTFKLHSAKVAFNLIVSFSSIVIAVTSVVTLIILIKQQPK